MLKMSTRTSPRRILGIDPGYDRCGVAIIERHQPPDRLLYSACLTSPRGDFPTRLVVIGDQLKKIFKVWQPTEVALETLFMTTNQKTVMRVAEVRGLIIYLAGIWNVPLREFSPPTIKQSVTGFGRADKKQVMLMVSRLLALSTRPKLDDEYDAIAVALTALAQPKQIIHS